jgi:hypothetical protein
VGSLLEVQGVQPEDEALRAEAAVSKKQSEPLPKIIDDLIRAKILGELEQFCDNLGDERFSEVHVLAKYYVSHNPARITRRFDEIAFAMKLVAGPDCTPTRESVEEYKRRRQQ